MRVKTKKSVNGQSVVIFDTEGMSVAELIPEMFDEGWTFSQLVATYVNKNGEKVRKNVAPEKAPAIYKKHPQLTKWSFSAANGDATIDGTIDCSKNAVAVTRSTGGGIRFFANLGSSYVVQPQPQAPEPASQPPYTPAAQAPQNGYVQSAPEYGTPYQNAPAYQETQAADTAIAARNQERREHIAPPADPDTKSTQKPFKFWLYYLFAILELPWIASTTFAIISLIETRHAQKEPDYELAKNFLSTSRILLIGGAVSAILMIVLLIWIFGLPFK